MKQVKCYPLIFAEDFYIHIGGFVYYKFPSIPLAAYYKNKDIVVKINGKVYSLLNLMLEYFFTEKEIKENKFYYTVSKIQPLRIPKHFIFYESIKEEKLKDSDKFNIKTKVQNANTRAVDKIRDTDLIYILKKYNYSCRYCGNRIENYSWHLDHIKPLAQNGKNKVENLAVSCPSCNMMKNSMVEQDFLGKCKKIVKYNKLL